MTQGIHILLIIYILILNIAYSLDYGPVDIPEGVKLRLGFRHISFSPTHKHYSTKSNKVIHNGSIPERSDDGQVDESNHVDTDGHAVTGMEDQNTNHENQWISAIKPNIFQMYRMLKSIGIKNPPSMDRCKDLNGDKQMICIEQVLLDFKDLFETCSEILLLNMRIMFGGSYANKALTRLNTISALAQNRPLLLMLGTSAIIYFYLMRESVSDRTRWLAQTVLSRITDLPVANNIADMATGGYGHVNILLPNIKRVRSADRYVAPLLG